MKTSPVAHVAAMVFACAAIAIVIVPFWPWVLVALWLGGLVASLFGRVLRRTRRRRATAVLLTVTTLVAIAGPFVAIVVPLSFEAIALVRGVVTKDDARKMLEALVSPANGAPMPAASLEGLLRLGSSDGERAYSFLRHVVGATSHVGFAIVVFVVALYVRLAYASEIRRWTFRHAAVSPRLLARLAGAFAETGRGLFIGIGGAGLAQALVATCAYAVLGVPHAFVLGLLTLLTAVVPGVGAAFVWVPVAAGLASTGRTSAAVVLAIVGVAIVGTVDNVVRPILARYGRLDLPIPLVLVSMLGGFTLAGPPGLLLGPLVVRLAKELLVLAREARGADRRKSLRRGGREVDDVVEKQRRRCADAVGESRG